MSQLADYVLHLGDHLDVMLLQYGPWFWALLFLVLFAETGLVITPFLPGDTVLFATGTLLARGGTLSIWWVFALLVTAVFLGDTVNYWIGRKGGSRVLRYEDGRVLRREYIDRTRSYFARYGGKTVVIARFVPIVRTFAPFLAGVGAMDYPHFITYNVLGGIAWVAIFLFGGYLFGNIPFVKQNLALALLVLVVVTSIPIVAHYVRLRRARHTSVT